MTTFSDVLLYTLEATEELNQRLAAVIKSESALKVCNESATYYALANEGFTDKVKEYAAAAWKFIKDLVNKIKDYIVSAYKKVRDFIAKKIAAIKAKFSKKEGGEEKPAEAKPEAKASEAADDFRYYVGASSFDEFTKMEALVKSVEDAFDIETIGHNLKAMSDEDIASSRKEAEESGEGGIKQAMKAAAMASISGMRVNKVAANSYSSVAAAYVANYNKVAEKAFKSVANIANSLEKFANSLNTNAEYTSEQVSFAKFMASNMGKVASIITSIRTRSVALDLSLVPATGFISEEAAKSAFDEYKEKSAALYE